MNFNLVLIGARLAPFLFCCLLGMSSQASGAELKGPKPVDVGIYLNNIPTVNLKEKNFQVDFSVWFRWTGEDINPVETFKLFNGRIDGKEVLEKKKIGNSNYALARVGATIFRNFDVSRFPLDSQTLKIQIEDGKLDGNAMTYVPDKANTNVSAKITVPGWTVGGFDSYNSVTSYQTNYGDSSLGKDAEAQVPRYTFSIDLKRDGYGNFFKYFSLLFLAAALTFIGFCISSELIDTRFFLSTSSIFMAAFTGSALATSLPETSSFVMGDRLYQLTMAVIFIATLVFIYEHRVFGSDLARARRLSRQWGCGLTLAYLVAVFSIVRYS